MSTATAPAAGAAALSRTVVWLPLALASRRSDTGMSEFLQGQMTSLADSLPAVAQDVVSPDALGMRSDFAARLASSLSSGAGTALEDFALLVEGSAYGLLTPKRYDLQAHSLSGSCIEDRYITLLMFRSHAQANETCAGSFAGETLVCPAPAWRERDALRRMVLQNRQKNEAVAARGLLAAFLASYGGSNILWMRALQAVLSRNPGQDPGETHQRNIGAFYLRIAPNADPQRVFLPTYHRDYLENLARRVCSESAVPGSDQLDFFHQGRLVCSLSRAAHQEPALFGYGCEIGDGGSGGPPVVQLSQEVLDRLGEISNAYLASGAPAHPRFELPDCLRYFFCRFGASAQYMLAPAESRYSFYALSRMAPPLPHEITAAPGLHRDANKGDLFYVDAAGGDLSYYVESLRGTPVGEMSALGYVLWLLFTNQAAWDNNRAEVIHSNAAILGQRHGRLWITDGLQPTQPDPTRRAAELLSFVAAAEQQAGLFQESARTYLGALHPTFSRRGSVHQTEHVSLAGRSWWRIR